MKKVTEKREVPHNSIHTKKSYRIQNEPHQNYYYDTVPMFKKLYTSTVS